MLHLGLHLVPVICLDRDPASLQLVDLMASIDARYKRCNYMRQHHAT
jgi:hypothetical protein